MSLSTYTDLKAAIADWLNRSDLTSQIPDFIRLVEGRLRRMPSTRGRTYSQSSVTGVTSFNGVYANGLALPEVSWGSLARVVGMQVEPGYHGNTQAVQLELVPYDTFWETIARYGGTSPRFWCMTDHRDGNEIYGYIGPTSNAGGSVKVTYERYYPALETAAGGTNYLLTYHPDVYLYGALAEAAPFLREDERVPVWERRFKEAVDELVLDKERFDYGNGPLIARPKRALG